MYHLTRSQGWLPAGGISLYIHHVFRGVVRTCYTHCACLFLLINSWRRGALGLAAAAVGVGLTVSQPMTAAWSEEVPVVRSCPQLRPQGNGSEPLSERFKRAIADAGSIEECERWDGLAAIRIDNPDLIWDAAREKVLMVTWVADNTIYAKLKPESTITLQGSLWATPVPSIRTMLLREVYKTSLGLSRGGVGGTNPSLDVVRRTEQYLGLAHNSRYGTFVEFWVAPQKLVRACDDPEIDDVRCQGKPGASGQLPAKPPQYYAKEAQGFPFTGIGYTYDWGNDLTEVGASEFVVSKGAKIRVRRVASNEEYLFCGVSDPAADPAMPVQRVCGKD
jgi:hypothetical protein